MGPAATAATESTGEPVRGLHRNQKISVARDHAASEKPGADSYAGPAAEFGR